MSIPLKELSEPFPADQIRQRKGNFGAMLDYAEASTVIQRLNDALEGEWSFSILDYRIDPDEVIVHGQLAINGVIHQQFGGSSVTRKTDSGEVISIADDLKAAAADCLKKCASSFGVGLYLYGGSTQGNNGQRKFNGNGRITNETIARIFSTAKEAGVPQSQVIKTANDLFSKPISRLTNEQADQLMEQFQGDEHAAT